MHIILSILCYLVGLYWGYQLRKEIERKRYYRFIEKLEVASDNHGDYLDYDDFYEFVCEHK